MKQRIRENYLKIRKKKISFCNEEILNYKNSNKHFYHLCMKKINMKINNDLTLKNESLFQKVMRYRILNMRLIDQLEIEKMDMLKRFAEENVFSRE